jgi:hypothetical protein
MNASDIIQHRLIILERGYTMHEIREMTIENYDKSIALWRVTEGMWLSEADSRDSIN